MKKLCLLVMILGIGGCATQNNIGGSFNKLDSASLQFINNDRSNVLENLPPQSARPGQYLKDTDIAFAASGGGIRAAALSVGFMHELQYIEDHLSTEMLNKVRSKIKDRLNALSEIDYFSTVSGGGWGVGGYLARRVKSDSGTSNYVLDSKEMESIRNSLAGLKMNMAYNCLIEKLDISGVTSHQGSPITMRDLFSIGLSEPSVPFLFSNATITASHAPFVFDSHDFKHFDISEASYCHNRRKKFNSFSDVPLSLAVGTSGSVPGFRFTRLKSNICYSENSPVINSWLCWDKPKYLHLVDGGIYDNLGYKTALNLLRDTSGAKKALIVLDAAADTYQPLEQTERSSNIPIVLSTARMSSLAVGDITAKKVLQSYSNGNGVDSLLIGMYDLTNFRELSTRYSDLTDGKSIMDGLDSLKAFLKTDENNNKTLCIYPDEKNLSAKNTRLANPLEDCMDNKVYRAGMSAMTTHWLDKSYYTMVQDIGRLLVRVHANELADLML